MCYRIEKSVVAKNAIAKIGICRLCKLQMNGGTE
jgi:hypothetical protein